MADNPNPYGVNQLGEAHVPYGQVKQAKTLAREAPMSGAPLATNALNTPNRVRQPRTTRAAPVQQAAVQQAAAPIVAPPQVSLVTRAQQLGDLEGASPLVKQFAQEAILEAAGT